MKVNQFDPEKKELIGTEPLRCAQDEFEEIPKDRSCRSLNQLHVGKNRASTRVQSKKL